MTNTVQAFMVLVSDASDFDKAKYKIERIYLLQIEAINHCKMSSDKKGRAIQLTTISQKIADILPATSDAMKKPMGHSYRNADGDVFMYPSPVMLEMPRKVSSKKE